MIYLDNAATSYPKPECVYEAVLKCMKEYGANPGRSGHRMAIEAGKTVYRCRELLSELFNIPDPMDIVFTYNATDAINLAIKGFIHSGDHIIATSMEHNAVARPLTALKTQGVDVSFVPCGSDGILNAADVEHYIRRNTRLIAMTHASNVTGTILPINEVSKIAHEHEITFLVDASQTAGTCDIDVAEMNIDII